MSKKTNKAGDPGDRKAPPARTVARAVRRALKDYRRTLRNLA